MTAITDADRDRAWHYRPNCYHETDRECWMAGLYDKAAPIIRDFARHREAALEEASKRSRLEHYLANEAAAKAELETYPVKIRDRLHAWQEGQQEWFSNTLLEIVAEFIRFEDRALKGNNDAG